MYGVLVVRRSVFWSSCRKHDLIPRREDVFPLRVVAVRVVPPAAHGRRHCHNYHTHTLLRVHLSQPFSLSFLTKKLFSFCFF